MDTSKILKSITRYIGNYYNYELTPTLSSAMRDSLSRGQLMSKVKIIELTEKYRVDNAFFIGHWHGLLPMFFYEYDIIKSGSGIEIDPFWVEFSNKLNYYWNWNSIIGDADNFVPPNTDMIINTSCEHMSDNWLNFVKSGTIVCAQSTDYNHPTHINVSPSFDDFIQKWSKFTILESASDRYDIYSRFTVIAIKN